MFLPCNATLTALLPARNAAVARRSASTLARIIMARALAGAA